MLKEVPSMIQNKINQIYKDELDENKKQNKFLNDLKNQIILEIKEQRKKDNLKFKEQINE